MFTHFVSELKTKEGSLFRLVMKHPARSRGGVHKCRQETFILPTLCCDCSCYKVDFYGNITICSNVLQMD